MTYIYIVLILLSGVYDLISAFGFILYRCHLTALLKELLMPHCVISWGRTNRLGRFGVFVFPSGNKPCVWLWFLLSVSSSNKHFKQSIFHSRKLPCTFIFIFIQILIAPQQQTQEKERWKLVFSPVDVKTQRATCETFSLEMTTASGETRSKCIFEGNIHF